MIWMQDDFEHKAKKMWVYGIIASIISGAVSLGFMIVVLYAIKHIFF